MHDTLLVVLSYSYSYSYILSDFKERKKIKWIPRQTTLT